MKWKYTSIDFLPTLKRKIRPEQIYQQSCFLYNRFQIRPFHMVYFTSSLKTNPALNSIIYSNKKHLNVVNFHTLYHSSKRQYFTEQQDKLPILFYEIPSNHQ